MYIINSNDANTGSGSGTYPLLELRERAWIYGIDDRLMVHIIFNIQVRAVDVNHQIGIDHVMLTCIA